MIKHAELTGETNLVDCVGRLAGWTSQTALHDQAPYVQSVKQAISAAASFAVATEIAKVRTRKDELRAQLDDSSHGLAKLFALIKGETAPPTSAMANEGRTGPTSNVDLILRELGRKWASEFSKRKGAQPRWSDVELLIRDVLTDIPPPPQATPSPAPLPAGQPCYRQIRRRAGFVATY